MKDEYTGGTENGDVGHIIIRKTGQLHQAAEIEIDRCHPCERVTPKKRDRKSHHLDVASPLVKVGLCPHAGAAFFRPCIPLPLRLCVVIGLPCDIHHLDTRARAKSVRAEQTMPLEHVGLESNRCAVNQGVRCHVALQQRIDLGLAGTRVDHHHIGGGQRHRSGLLKQIVNTAGERLCTRIEAVFDQRVGLEVNLAVVEHSQHHEGQHKGHHDEQQNFLPDGHNSATRLMASCIKSLRLRCTLCRNDGT